MAEQKRRAADEPRPSVPLQWGDEIDLAALKAAAQAATPGPWVGDRYDGTVKYSLLGADGTPVISGDNGNSDAGSFGIHEDADEKYLMAAHPAAILALLDRLERAEQDLADARSGWESAAAAAREADGKAWSGELPPLPEDKATFQTCIGWRDFYRPDDVEAWGRAAIGAALEAAAQAVERDTVEMAHGSAPRLNATRFAATIRALNKLAPAGDPVLDMLRQDGDAPHDTYKWAWHAALGGCAALLDNMRDEDPITDTPKFLAAKLADLAGAAQVGARAVTQTDAKTIFEEFATKDGTYDLRPAKVKMLSVGGVPYDGYVRPYLQDRTVYTYEGFAAALALVAAPGVLEAAAPTDAIAVPRSTLDVIYAAMNHMGDVLNGMDAVEAEDEEKTEPAFDALRAILGQQGTEGPRDE